MGSTKNETIADLYHQLVDAVVDYAIYMLDLQGFIVSWNQGAARCKGYSSEEAIGLHFSRFYTEEDRRAGLPESALSTAKTQGKFEGSGNRVRKDGSIFWANVIIRPMLNKSGTLIGYCKVTRDMTEIKKQQEEEKIREKELRLATSQLENIFQSMTDGIIIRNAQGDTVRSNPSARQILGLSEEELNSENLKDKKWQCWKPNGEIFPVSEFPAVKTLQTGKAHKNVPMIIQKKNGNSSWVNVSAIPIFDVNTEASEVLVIISDQTELQKHKSDLEDTLNFVPVGIFNTDKDGNVLYVNKAWSEITGVSKEQVMSSGWIQAIHPEDREKLLSGRKIAAENGMLLQLTFRCVHPNGEIRYVLCKRIPSLNSQGNMTGYLGSIQDITELKTSEKQLEEAQHLAQQASKAKSEFLATMSHEIRTPLNGVIGMSNLLLETNLTENQQELAQAVSNSGKSLLILINDILDFSKIEAGKMDLDQTEFDPNEVFKEMLNAFTLIPLTSNLKFIHDIELCPSYLIGDPGRICQIFSNILSNAFKFTKAGSITIKIEFKVKESETLLIFRAIDTGIGIKETSKSKIFKVFSQAESSTNREFGGTGLGLSISKNLTEMMKGTIAFESEFGVGTTFLVNLPLKTGKLKTSESIDSDSGYNSEVKKKILRPGLAYANSLAGNILIAEDNPTNQNLIRRMLLDLGCSSQTAINGYQVLELLEEQTFDLILMDCRMPGMDGYEATQIIRNKTTKKYRDIPIVALTANVSAEDKNRCLFLGMNDFIGKPISKEKLYHAIKKYMINLKKNELNIKEKASINSMDIDQNIINDLISLNSEEDPGFFDQQKSIFTSYTKELLTKLIDAHKNKELEIISNLAHSMKGSSASFGAKKVASVCKNLENNVKTMSPSEVDNAIEQLKKDLELFFDYLDHLKINKE